MKHARADYDRIQDPAGKIGADEAVFLIRARDVCMPRALMDYATRALEVGAEDDLIMATVEQALLARRQQREGARTIGNDGLRCHIPDL
jgi:hypothetical protein